MSLYSRLDRLAADVEKLNRQVTAVANSPQSQRTSVEGGSIDFNDADGNLKAIVGEQEDGGNTVNVIAGPTPPTPTNFTVTVDHGSLTVHWDGDFEGGAVAPTDWARWTAYAQPGGFVVPDRTTSIGGTDSASGGEVTAGVLKGEWTVTLLAWSQAGKPSAMAEPVTVDVPGYGDIVLAEIDAAETTIKNAGEILVSEQDTLNDKLDDAFGQIEDAIVSANGKNVVHYEDAPPTESDPGVEGDTWFVGEFGRPTDVVQATNLARNPKFATLSEQASGGVISPGGGAVLSVGDGFLRIAPGSGNDNAAYAIYSSVESAAAWQGKTLTVSATLRLMEPQSGSINANARRLNPGYVRADGSVDYGLGFSPQAPNTVGDHRLSVTITVPADARAWFVRFRSGSTVGSTFWTDVQIEEGSAATEFFYGGTPSGESDNDPHYRWTGEPHASTSEKYLPASNTSNWEIREQYKFTGGVWVQVELNHQVISSMDVGKLVAGSAAIKEAVVQKLFAEVVVAKTAVAEQFIGENAILTGAVTAPKITASEELWAKIAQFVKIRAEHIEADAIDGMVITGATYRTSGGNGSWSDAGLFIAQPDGTSMVRFPTDGSPLSLTASDTQIERASIGKLDVESGAIRSGGTFNLASGVTPPPSPPEATAAWDMTVNLPRPPEQRMDWNGFAAWGDKWVRGVNVLGTGEGDRLEVYNADGTLNKTIPILIDPRHDLTVIGDVCYVFGKDHVVTANDVYCFAYNLTTGVRVARWRFSTNAPNQQIGVTSVGSDLLTAQVSADGDTLIVRRRDASTGLVIESSPSGDAVWDLNYTNDVQGIHWDGTDLYVTHRDSTRVYTYSGSGYTRKAGSSNGTQWAGWANPNRNAGGMVFVDGVPVVVSGALYKGSTAASDYTSEMCFTWYDGTHETTASPVAVVDVAARETVTVSLPVRAGLQKRLYARAQGGTNWSRATVAADTTAAPAPVGSASYAPPTTNSFPNAYPATLKSTNDKFEVKGDGSGKWGPLTFNADGSMTSTQIPAWVPITSFGSGFGPQTFGYAPAYRVWPDGKVEWRGVVAGSMAAGSSGDYAILTIPAEARPSQSVDMISATGTGGGAHGMVRVEYTNAINPDKLMVLVRQANITWVSLDGHYYYKD